MIKEKIDIPNGIILVLESGRAVSLTVEQQGPDVYWMVHGQEGPSDPAYPVTEGMLPSVGEDTRKRTEEDGRGFYVAPGYWNGKPVWNIWQHKHGAGIAAFYEGMQMNHIEWIAGPYYSKNEAEKALDLRYADKV